MVLALAQHQNSQFAPAARGGRGVLLTNGAVTKLPFFGGLKRKIVHIEFILAMYIGEYYEHSRVEGPA